MKKFIARIGCLFGKHDFKVFPTKPYTNYICRHCGLDVRN